MQKLIELLNEYDPFICWDGTYTDSYWSYVLDWHSTVYPKSVAKSVIISKSYWFIEWLVKEDKIDLDNEELVSLMSELWERRNPVKCLLMLLSIQDEPIRFLCEILK